MVIRDNLHKSFLNQKEGFKKKQKKGEPLQQGRAFYSSRFTFKHNSSSEYGGRKHTLFCTI